MITRSQEPEISVIIVTRGRSALLDRCLESLQAQVDPPRSELLLASHDDDRAAEIAHLRFPEATIVEVKDAYPGGARNLLIEQARGDLLLFLDDDVDVRPDLLTRLAGLARQFPDVSVFGGPNLTPRDSSQFQRVQGAVLASLVATGPVRRRYGEHPAQLANEFYFTLCNLAVRRTHMPLFDPYLVCAEENAAMSEMHDRGLLMRYDPGLVVFHERRDTYRSFCQQMYKYGKGRGQVLRDAPRIASLPHVVPTLFMSYVAVAPVLALVLGSVWLLPLSAYAAAVAAGGINVAITLKARTAPLAIALITSLHASYGAGVLAGLLRGRGRRARSESAGHRSNAAFAVPR